MIHKKNILLTIFMVILSTNSEAKTMKNSDIILSISSLAKTPWEEQAGADARASITANVLGQLIEIDENQGFISKYLDMFNWDFKNQQYILKLKPNLKFHNGRVVNSQDLEFCLLRPYLAKNANESSTLFMNIFGLDKIKRGDTYKSGMVEGIKIINNTTITVKPKAPNPTFLYTISRPNYSLVPFEEFLPDLLTWKKWPVGVGNYKIKDADIENGIFTLELVNNELKNAPKIVYFETKNKNNPDIFFEGFPSFKKENYIEEKISGYSSKRVISFNFNSKLGSDLNFRKAVELALDREVIARKTTLDSEALYEVIPPNNIGRINIKSEKNLEKAKLLFKQSLGDDYNKKVFLIPNTIDEIIGIEYKNEVKKQLADAGLKVEFKTYSKTFNVFENEFSHAPFRLKSQITDFYEPILFFTFFKSTSRLIQERPIDKKFDDLFTDAQLSPSIDILNIKLKELSSYVDSEKLQITLFALPAKVFYNKNKIQSVGSQAGGSILRLSNIKLKENYIN
ncbi:ABC transporter substrate-binding protein [Fluviispira vulneris]|uniref:ABC transporter substrate-binding protein n=1 Tax=Fluviispira vulneris TaxID=2763012 RepID=UPI0016487776|nr:ABC transporter substrate-binding protein [Fluviispira vulneris]